MVERLLRRLGWHGAREEVDRALSAEERDLVRLYSPYPDEFACPSGLRRRTRVVETGRTTTSQRVPSR
jgi:hypothetical protein